MADDEIFQTVDYINNFDEKNINVCFLFTIGRSGSLLLQTLLDNHPEIILIPKIIYYYFEWEKINKTPDNPIELITNFLTMESINAGWSYDIELGVNKNETYDLQPEKFSEIILKILKHFTIINRKTFFLAIHFAYALLHNQNITKIKCIFLHHHLLDLFPKHKYFSPTCIKQILSDYFLQKNTFFSQIFLDFPQAKLIVSVREPFESYFSFLNTIKRKDSYFSSIRFFITLHYLVFSYHSFINQQFINKKNIKIVKFEDLHLKTENIMKDIAEFIGVSFNPTLFESTIDGKLWWGKPVNDINGTNQNLKTDMWKEGLDIGSKYLCQLLFKNIVINLGYKLEDININNQSLLIENEFNSHLLSLFIILKYKFYQNNSDIRLLEIYPLLKNTLIKCIAKFNNMSFEDIIRNLDNDIRYKETDLIIQYDFIDSLNISKKGFLILIQYWEHWSLPELWVNRFNKEVDQIWVFSSFIKNSYVNSGVEPEKIEIIPYPINTDLFRPFTENVVDNKKFIFLCFISEKSGANILLDAYCEEFKPEEHVCLAMCEIAFTTKNTVLMDKINIINNDPLKPNISLIHVSSNEEYEQEFYFEENLPQIYNYSDCFVYPYKTEGIGANILEAMACERIIITTKGGVALDFCNSENSYLINNNWEDCKIDYEDELNLTGNKFEFNVEKEHLKQILRHVFTNQDEAKIKARKGRESVVKNYSYKNCFDKIDKVINKIKHKPVLRFNLEKIKSDLFKQAQKTFELNDYSNSEIFFEKLIRYDLKNTNYLYKLALIKLKLLKYNEAINYFVESIELGLYNHDVFYNLAYCLDKEGENELASLYFQKAEEFT